MGLKDITNQRELPLRSAKIDETANKGSPTGGTGFFKTPAPAKKKPKPASQKSDITLDEVVSPALFLNESCTSVVDFQRPFRRRKETIDLPDTSMERSIALDDSVSSDCSIAQRLFSRKKRKVTVHEDVADVSFASSKKDSMPSLNCSSSSSTSDGHVAFRKNRKETKNSVLDISREASIVEGQSRKSSLDSSGGQRNLFQRKRKAEDIDNLADLSFASSAGSDVTSATQHSSIVGFLDISSAASEIRDVRDATGQPSETMEAVMKPMSDGIITRASLKIPEHERSKTLADAMSDLSNPDISIRSNTSSISTKRPFSELHAPLRILHEISHAKSPTDPQSPLSQDILPRPFSNHQLASNASLADVEMCESQKDADDDNHTTPVVVSTIMTRSRSLNMSLSRKSDRSTSLNTSNAFQTPAIVSNKKGRKPKKGSLNFSQNSSALNSSSMSTDSGRGPIFAARAEGEVADVTYSQSQPDIVQNKSTPFMARQKPFSGRNSTEQSMDCISFHGSQSQNESQEVPARPFGKKMAPNRSVAAVSFSVSPNLNETEVSTQGVSKPFRCAVGTDQSMEAVGLALSPNSECLAAIPHPPLTEMQNLQQSFSRLRSPNSSLMRSANKSLRVMVLERSFQHLENNVEESDREASKTSDESKEESTDESSKSESSSSSSSEEDEEEKESELESEKSEDEAEVEDPESAAEEEEENKTEAEELEPPTVEKSIISEDYAEDAIRESVNVPTELEETFSSTRGCSADICHDDLSALSHEASNLSLNQSINKTVLPAKPPIIQNEESSYQLPAHLAERIQAAIQRAKEKNLRLRMQYMPVESPPPKKPPTAARPRQFPRIKKYKPAYWANKRLYDCLEKTLKPTYGLNHVLKAEEIVRKMFDTHQKVMKSKTHDINSINDLKVHLANEKIVRTTDDFHKFLDTYMPPAFCDKVIPMLRPFTGITWPPNVNHKRSNEPILSP